MDMMAPKCWLCCWRGPQRASVTQEDEQEQQDAAGSIPQTAVQTWGRDVGAELADQRAFTDGFHQRSGEGGEQPG